MSLYKTNETPAWDNHYHFISVVFKRREVFMTDEIRSRVKEIFMEKANNLEVKVSAITVAYNHVHILIKAKETDNISKIGQGFNGATSFKLRKEFPELKKIHEKKLWGGTSSKNITDETHLANTISYINRHQPDNTKVD